MLRRGFAAMLAVACGCSGGGTTSELPKFPSDIDSGLTLDHVGEAGLREVCSTFETWLLDQYRSSHLTQLGCLARAVENTNDAVACGEQLKMCIDNPPAEIGVLVQDVIDQAGCGAFTVSASGCEATVSQVYVCLEALADEVDRVQHSVTCAAVGEPLPSDWWRLSLPGACSTLEAECS